MAVTISAFNQMTRLLADESGVSFADLKVMLLDDTAEFDPTDTNISSYSGKEVYGNGWTQGGEALANAAVTTVSTKNAKLDADDIEVTATGGAIGPASYAVIYDSDSGNLLCWIDFDGEKDAGETTPFKIVWHANGIITFTLPS